MNRCRYFFPFSSFILYALISCNDQPTGTDSVQNGEKGYDGDPPINDFSHTLSPGSSNGAFITDNEFDQIVVEIQYIPGSQPNTGSINNLWSFLKQHLDKASITILVRQKSLQADSNLTPQTK